MNKFHGLGLTVKETLHVMSMAVSKAQRRSMPSGEHLSVQPGRRRGHCDWKER